MGQIPKEHREKKILQYSRKIQRRRARIESDENCIYTDIILTGNAAKLVRDHIKQKKEQGIKQYGFGRSIQSLLNELSCMKNAELCTD